MDLFAYGCNTVTLFSFYGCYVMTGDSQVSVVLAIYYYIYNGALLYEM